MRTRPLLQASFIIGERLVFLVPQATLFVLVSRHLGREIFGQYTLILTWAVLFQTYANFGITECLAKEIGREPEHGSAHFTHGLVLATGFAVAMALMAPAAWAMHYPLEVRRAILLAGGTLLPAGILGACRGALLAGRQIEYMTAIAVVENLILLPLNVYWVLAGAGLLPIVATFVAAKVVAAGLALAVVHARVSPLRLPLDRGLLARLWRVSAPFGIAAQMPAIRLDILLLSKMTSFGVLGLYSAGSKIAELLLVFPLAFYLTMLPRVANGLAGGAEPAARDLKGPLAWYFALVIPLGVAVIGLAEPILRLVYDVAFVVAAPVLRVQTTAFLLTTVDAMLMMVCRAAGFQGKDLRLVLITAGSNLVLLVLLIPPLGGVGAALAAALSILIGLVLRWRLVTRFIIRLEWSGLIAAPLLASMLLVPLLLLWDRLPWPLVGLGYLTGYTALALTTFPLVSETVKRAWRRG